MMLNEARYYINLLVHNRRYNNDDDEADDDYNSDDISGCGSVYVNLTRLMSFPRLEKACNNDIDCLRYVYRYFMVPCVTFM